jgi:hypothetical protein
MLLGFGDRTRTGVFNMVWSLMIVAALNSIQIHSKILEVTKKRKNEESFNENSSSFILKNFK